MGNHGGAAVGSTEGVAPEEASLRKGRGKDIAPARQARRADAAPFSTLGLLDRLVFDNPEPLVTLAALAGATSRIRLQAEVLIAPQHNTALLAKQTATLDRLSGGRFTLGIGIGGREDDCRAAGIDLRRRGRRCGRGRAVLLVLGPGPGGPSRRHPVLTVLTVGPF